MKDDKRIEIMQADITQLKVAAVVNAANNSLLGGGGVDGAIHAAAGPKLLEECRLLKGCETGKAKITSGYDLPAQWVIHTVGPIWKDGKHGEAGLLADCYRECMALVGEYSIATVAFPAISCGVYGYPAEKAVSIALTTIMHELDNQPQIKKVVFCAFSEQMADIYRDEYKRLS